MDKETRIPLYIYDDYDHKAQEEWLQKQKEKKESSCQRGYENIDFNIENDLLIKDDCRRSTTCLID